MIINKKTKIEGSDTHSLDGDGGTDTHGASLTGVVSLANQTDYVLIGDMKTNAAANRTAGDKLLGTITLTINQAKNFVAFFVQLAGNMSASGVHTISVEEPASTILLSGSMPNGEEKQGSFNGVLVDESTGGHTYEAWLRTTGTGTQVEQKSFFAVVAEVTDTHAASLTGDPPTDTHSLGGSNTQKTRSHGIVV